MQLNQNIFRANDIRGIAFEDLSEDVVFNLGKALGSESLNRDEDHFIIGRDERLSSPEIFKWLSAGVLSTGCNVVNIGIVTSPMFYHATFELNSSSGVVITGSHNPGEYNGFKIVFHNHSTSTEEILLLRDRMLNQLFLEGHGASITEDIKESYIERILESVKLSKNLDIAIDCGNGAAGVVAKEVYERLGCNVTELFGEPDGNFPNHHPDPSKLENVKDLIEVVKDNQLKIGLAFDGDADRLGVISSKGDMIYPDMQMILFSRQIISEHPKAKIVFDVKCSNHLENLITKSGGEAIMSPTGHFHIKNAIKKTGALLAGEMSGHIYFKERWYGFDDGIYSAARLCEILAASDTDIDGLFAHYPDDISTPEMNIPVTDNNKFAIIEAAQAWPYDGQVSTIDGLRVDFADGWGLIRASNTTPLLVLRFEAENETALVRIRHQFQQHLLSIDKDLIIPE